MDHKEQERLEQQRRIQRQQADDEARREQQRQSDQLIQQINQNTQNIISTVIMPTIIGNGS